jgi:hypothetical protein
MGDLIRLLEGLRAGDPEALAVLAFSVNGTAVIVTAATPVRRGRD